MTEPGREPHPEMRVRAATPGRVVARLGHASRLRLHPTARWLISAHLVIFALSLEDEEIVAMMADAWGLGLRAQVWAEALLSLALLVVWGFLTVGWVRFAGAMRREAVE